jgi:hypothetical protein
MNPPPAQLKEQLLNDVFCLRAAMDEIRRNLHAGGHEAEEQWQRLEPLATRIIERAEQLEVSEDLCSMAREALGAVDVLCAKLNQRVSP